jgi:hypothetical protein
MGRTNTSSLTRNDVDVDLRREVVSGGKSAHSRPTVLFSGPRGYYGEEETGRNRVVPRGCRYTRCSTEIR